MPTGPRESSSSIACSLSCGSNSPLALVMPTWAATACAVFALSPVNMTGSIPSDLSSAIACRLDRKSTRLNSSHLVISYAVFCLKKKKNHTMTAHGRHNRGLPPTQDLCLHRSLSPEAVYDVDATARLLCCSRAVARSLCVLQLSP